MQVFTQEARRDIGYYIMPRSVYPHGMLTEQVYSGDPELAAYLEGLHLSPDTFNPAWIHANYRQGPVLLPTRHCFPEHASCICMYRGTPSRPEPCLYVGYAYLC